MAVTNRSKLDSQFLSLSDIFYCWIEFGTTDHWTVSHGSQSAFIGVLFIYFPLDFSFVRVPHSWASISLRLPCRQHLQAKNLFSSIQRFFQL